MNRVQVVHVAATGLWWWACSCGERAEPTGYTDMVTQRRLHIAGHANRRESWRHE